MKRLLIISLFLLLFGCEKEDEYNMRQAIGHEFGIPITENIIMLCYKNELYKVIKINSKSQLIPNDYKIIPILDNPNNINSTKLKKCTDFYVKSINTHE